MGVGAGWKIIWESSLCLRLVWLGLDCAPCHQQHQVGRGWRGWVLNVAT